MRLSPDVVVAVVVIEFRGGVAVARDEEEEGELKDLGVTAVEPFVEFCDR